MTAFPYLSFPTFTTITISIDTLANGSLALGSTVIDNSLTGNRYDNILIDISLNSFNPAGPSPIIEGWLVASPDGTNYLSIDASATPLGGTMTPYALCFINTGAAAKRAALNFVNCLPLKYKLLLKNSTGTAFATGSKTVQWSGTLRETR